jgi:hypothetical protein
MISVRGSTMGPDEIRAEIERRKKRAKDLRLRELLWNFYKTNLKYVADRLNKDPELLYPEFKDTLEIAEKYFQFRIGGMSCRFFYEEETGERAGWSGRGERNETTATPIRIALEVEEKRVFEFKMMKSVTSTPDFPMFNESMGEILSFIEGPWVTELPEIQEKIKLYQKAIRDRRNAPRVQQKLQEDMKKFGL